MMPTYPVEIAKFLRRKLKEKKEKEKKEKEKRPKRPLSVRIALWRRYPLQRDQHNDED